MATQDRTRLTGPLFARCIASMKIKVKPNDFIVQEHIGIDVSTSGPFALYQLRKYGWNTTDVLDHIARNAGIPRSCLRYGGRKDRWALTVQHITADPECTLDLSTEFRASPPGESFYELRRIGAISQPMSPSLITGNSFQIVVRELELAEANRALDRARTILPEFGVPNYFDDQRFRGTSQRTGFAAERIMKGQWRGALQAVLDGLGCLDTLDDWEDWSTVYLNAQQRWVRRICKYMQQHPRDYLGALHLIPQDDLAMYYSAFQAFLWNELLRRALVNLGLPLSAYPGETGPYLFLEPDVSVHQESLRRLRQSSAMLPGPKASYSDELLQQLYLSILEERGLRPSDFNVRRLRTVYFKAVPRALLVTPAELHVSGPEPDELHPGKFKLRIEFELPRGSYGTIVVKSLFARKPEEGEQFGVQRSGSKAQEHTQVST